MKKLIIIGLLLMIAMPGLALDTGSIQVFINPSLSISQGAQWRPQGAAQWYDSGHTLSGFKPEKQIIEFKPLDCWDKPTDQIVYVVSNNTTIVRVNYIQKRGSIMVHIEPNTIQGRWLAQLIEVNGETSYYVSDEIVGEFIPGDYLIQFEKIDGWDAPEDMVISVQCDGIATANVRYCQQNAPAPDQISASDGDSIFDIIIKWTNQPCIDTNSILRNTINDPNSAEEIAVVSNTTTYTDTTASPLLMYYYWVRSVNQYGSHDVSSPDTGYRMLQTTLFLTASDGDFTDAIQLDWAPVEGALYYEIWRSRYNNSLTAECINPSVAQTDYLDKTVKCECKYYYWIKAKNDHVTGPISISDDGYREMSVVQGVKATDGTFYTHVGVEWDEHPDAVTYSIIIAEMVPTKRRDAKSNSMSTTDTSIDDVIAIPEKRYYYRVIAKNECGESVPSAHDVGYRRLKYPENVVASQNFSDLVQLSWNPVDGAEWYIIYRGTTKDPNLASVLDSKVLRASFEDPLPPGKGYYYFVQSENQFGKSEMSVGILGKTTACAFQIFPLNQTFNLNEHADGIQISAAHDCDWYAITENPWIHIHTPTGNGIGEIAYTIDSTQYPRSGSITIKGSDFEQQVDIIQQKHLNLRIEGNGNVMINENSYTLPVDTEYDGATDLTITYEPPDGCELVEWSGSNEFQSAENPLNLQLTMPMTLTPILTCPVTLNLSIRGEGQISLDNEPVSTPFVQTVEKGSDVTLNVIDPINFLYWDVNGDLLYAQSVTLPCDSDKDIIAVFETGWSMTLDVFGEKLGGLDTHTLTIGIASEMPPEPEESPPLSPSYSVDASLLDSNWTKFTSYIHAEVEKSYSWVLGIDPHGNIGSPEARACTLTWNPDSLPEEGTFQLRKGFDGTGEIVIHDMREQDQYIIWGKAVTQYFTIILSDKTWRTELQAEGINLGGVYISTVTIGVENSEKQEEAAPPSPEFTCRMVLNPVYNFSTALSMDIQAYGNNTYAWTLSINPHGNIGKPEPRSCTVTWNPDTLSSSGYYTIREGYSGTGQVVVTDMRQVNQLIVTGGNQDIYYTIIWSEVSLFEISLVKGWNLISIPLLCEPNALTQLFPDAIIAYEFSEGGYKKTTYIEPGKGYWVKMPTEQTAILNGIEFIPNLGLGEDTTYNPQFRSGWNLIGLGMASVDLKRVLGERVGIIYKFEGGRYVRVDWIDAGWGYWVKIDKLR